MEAEGRGVAPGTGLVLERPRKGRREERAFLAEVLPDRGFDVPAPECVRWFFVRSHPVSSFVEMKVALSQDGRATAHFKEETQRKGRCRRAGEDRAAGVTVDWRERCASQVLAGRLACGYTKNTKSVVSVWSKGKDLRVRGMIKYKS